MSGPLLARSTFHFRDRRNIPDGSTSSTLALSSSGASRWIVDLVRFTGRRKTDQRKTEYLYREKGNEARRNERPKRPDGKVDEPATRASRPFAILFSLVSARIRSYAIAFARQNFPDLSERESQWREAAIQDSGFGMDERRRSDLSSTYIERGVLQLQFIWNEDVVSN